ncbi:unnamed protein product, partial [Prorocentrum cordatum]
MSKPSSASTSALCAGGPCQPRAVQEGQAALAAAAPAAGPGSPRQPRAPHWGGGSSSSIWAMALASSATSSTGARLAPTAIGRRAAAARPRGARRGGWAAGRS